MFGSKGIYTWHKTLRPVVRDGILQKCLNWMKRRNQTRDSGGQPSQDERASKERLVQDHAGYCEKQEEAQKHGTAMREAPGESVPYPGCPAKARTLGFLLGQ